MVLWIETTLRAVVALSLLSVRFATAINVGTGKELTIRELSELVVKAVGFEGEVEFDASKPDGTMRKLISVDKLHSLGWTHKVEIEDGVKKLFDWYQESLKG